MSQSPRPNSLSQVIVLSVLHDGLCPTQAALRFGLSRTCICQLLARYKTGGLLALEPISRRPHTNPRALSNELRQEIIRLRTHLLAQGLDAGAASISWHLRKAKLHTPALSTIWRILKAEGLVTPQPKKRPKAYITRFEAVQPNETWQSDFTHCRLEVGSDVEIINWLDDHSRLLLSCTVFSAITGKIERFHQTLKKWLSQQAPAKSIEKFQEQLDEFRNVYNTQRPHKALAMKTPQQSYEATIKATPKQAKDKEHYRVRHDSIDQFGKLSLRRAGKMHHLGVGIENQFKKVFVVVDHYKVSVVEKTGEVLSKHIIEPTRTYWTNFLVDELTKRSRKPK